MPIRYCIATLIAILSIVAAFFFGQRLMAQLHCLKAANLLRERHYASAATYLEKAAPFLPKDPLIWKNLGESYHNLGVSKPLKEAFQLATKARHAYLEAARLNPLDADTAYGLAREEFRMERMYPFIHLQGDNPHHAYPYFQQAIGLRPNGIIYHYAFARYLHWKRRKEALLLVVTNLARIYPLVISHLKKEAFWAPEVKEAVKKGLQQAIHDGMHARDAHRAMSSLLTDEKDWTGAISHYRELLDLQAVDKNSGQYLHLGRLYVQNGQFEAAQESFITALSMSESKEKLLEGLYGFYKAKGHSEELYRFYRRVSRVFSFSSRMDILLAQTLTDLNRYHQARRILIQLNKKRPTAETYYWLYWIAQKEKDWDTMESAMQKATVLDGQNSRYHLIYSQVLQQVKKLDHAETEAGLAIQYATHPSSSLYGHRAWIRWRKKDFLGALHDWKSAIRLEPKRANLHAHASEAYLKLGQRSQALAHLQKAVQLKPGNQYYQKKLKALMAADK
ncbi:MAG: hypothetical protein GY849_03495 [Deltaproteobacteria bacterium]|nr:hypothetical protein [Deltaproteobacteria bacterium]